MCAYDFSATHNGATRLLECLQAHMMGSYFVSHGVLSEAASIFRTFKFKFLFCSASCKCVITWCIAISVDFPVLLGDYYKCKGHAPEFRC
jgi:hypothetical protein